MPRCCARSAPAPRAAPSRRPNGRMQEGSLLGFGHRARARERERERAREDNKNCSSQHRASRQKAAPARPPRPPPRRPAPRGGSHSLGVATWPSCCRRGWPHTRPKAADAAKGADVVTSAAGPGDVGEFTSSCKRCVHAPMEHTMRACPGGGGARFVLGRLPLVSEARVLPRTFCGSKKASAPRLERTHCLCV